MQIEFNKPMPQQKVDQADHQNNIFKSICENIDENNADEIFSEFIKWLNNHNVMIDYLTLEKYINVICAFIAILKSNRIFELGDYLFAADEIVNAFMNHNYYINDQFIKAAIRSGSLYYDTAMRLLSYPNYNFTSLIVYWYLERPFKIEIFNLCDQQSIQTYESIWSAFIKTHTKTIHITYQHVVDGLVNSDLSITDKLKYSIQFMNHNAVNDILQNHYDSEWLHVIHKTIDEVIDKLKSEG